MREANRKRANVPSMVVPQIQRLVPVAFQRNEMEKRAPRRVDEKVLVRREAGVLKKKWSGGWACVVELAALTYHDCPAHVAGSNYFAGTEIRPTGVVQSELAVLAGTHKSVTVAGIGAAKELLIEAVNDFRVARGQHLVAQPPLLVAFETDTAALLKKTERECVRVVGKIDDNEMRW